MPDDMSVERQRLMTRFGAEIHLTPAIEGMTGAVFAAEELLREHPDYFMPQQFKNPANPWSHTPFGKATSAACEWIKANHPDKLKYLLSGNIDTDKKHSHINVLQTRGRRVVAEAVLRQVGEHQVVADRRHGQEPRLAEFALHVVFGGEPESAMKLQARVARLPRRVRGEQLRHVGFLAGGLAILPRQA